MNDISVAERCVRCGRKFSYLEDVIPLWRITHAGRVSTEMSLKQGPAQAVHLECPKG